MEDYICTSCGHQVDPKTKVRGSIWIELVLWLFFIIPGVIYSFWRLSNKYKVCPECGKETLIPMDSPMGKQLAKSLKKDS
jgi:predicted RNA-binding Zn-ribbon protein involved in translation (DUF1610 family)